MVLGVKIQNRETKKFMGKGGSWSGKGKTWSDLGYAKRAVCPMYWRYNNEVFVVSFAKELQSDFIIIKDDGIIEREPVASYFIDYLTREKRCYGSKEILEELIENIKKYCKENEIELEETKE